MVKFFTKILLISVLIFITSCDATKRVPEGEYLLKKNTIEVNKKKSANVELYSYLKQRPNQRLAGIPLALYVYNWSDPNFEKTFDQWIKNHPGQNKFFTSVFSLKQTKAVYRFNKNTNEWFKKNGEVPVIVDSLKTTKSENSLRRYYQYKGFFDANVTSESILAGNKQKKIKYNVVTNRPYFLDTIKTNIQSKVLDSLYQKTKKQSFIKKGQQFDLQNFKMEQNRLTRLFRNSGIFAFSKDYIQFELDSTKTKYILKNVKLIIPNQIIETPDSIYTKPFIIQKVSKINVYTDFSFKDKNRVYTDSVQYNGYTFWYHDKLKYNPKYLSGAIAITPNGVFKEEEQKATRQYLNELKIFRSPINIKYTELEDGNLQVDIYLTPLKKYGLAMDVEFTHSNIKPFGVLGKFSFLDRNAFKGLEIIDLSFQGSFLNVAEDTASPDFNFFGLTAWEIGTTASLKMPRIFFPLNTNKIIPKYMRPRTDISIGASLQKNIGLDRKNITGIMQYFWRPNKKTKHQLDVFNIQYINNLNPGSYFDIFGSELGKLEEVAMTINNSDYVNSDGLVIDPNGYIDYILNPLNNFYNTNQEEFFIVQRVKERQNIITEDVLVPTMTYTYTFSNKENINDNHFSYLRARIVESGTITSNLIKDEVDGKKILFGLPVANYIKTEVEYKKYWDFGRNNHLVFRTFLGAAIPFKKSSDIPFSRRYRAGGSNDIRAWKTFDLGPGSSQTNLEFNTGNLKLVTNLEYRFKFINSFYSALFIDAGNIWELQSSELTNDDAVFKGIKSYKEIAVGSGFGLRYDFSFLIFRLDVGFKAYEPYLEGDKWFRNFNFKHEVYNFGINYPF